MKLGTLASIWRYPVKSLRGESLESTAVAESGIPGDRSGALFVRGGHVRQGKTYRGKEHERLHLTADVDTAIAFARARGVQLEHHSGEHFFDDAPISMLLERWLRELSAHVGYEVEPERFRPNFFVHTPLEFALNEAALEDMQLQLGSVGLRVRYPIERCVTTTYDPRGGVSDPEILQFVARERNAWMGVYCDVIQPGTARTGDSLVLLP